MAQIQIKPKNILEPSEKVLRMYEAVHSFMLEKRDISTIKVVDITSAAGIGKGTAYEYFSSKEEIIASAMAYEYKNKITELVNCMFAQSGFKNRVMNVMDWIYDNQEYNQLFSHIFNEVMGEPRLPLIGSSIKQLESDNEAQTTAEDLKGGCRMMDDCVKYLDSIVSRLMQEAYDEGVITETDSTKRNITAMSGMIQYGCMLMMESHRQMSAMTDEQLRQFIYGNIIKCLN